MSEAHKTLCDDIYCEQFLCVQNRDAAKPMSKSQYRRIESQGGNALEMALSEIKTLKAENEALKKQTAERPAICAFCSWEGPASTTLEQIQAHSAVCEHHPLAKKLSLYTSWQPSDPGTKEAMKTCRPQSDEEGEKRMSWVDTAMTLSRALTAAMVRLEEAERGRDDEFR